MTELNTMSVHALSEHAEKQEQLIAELVIEKTELQQQLAAKDEALRDVEHFLTQIDPVHWPSRQEARKIITTIRNVLASPAAEPQSVNVKAGCLSDSAKSSHQLPDETVDEHLDSVLRASGSALRHHSMQKTIDDMRAAMRAAMLSTQWRAAADKGEAKGRDYVYPDVLRQCANELDAAMQAQPAPATDPAHVFNSGLETAAQWHERRAKTAAPGMGNAARHEYYAECLRELKIQPAPVAQSDEWRNYSRDLKPFEQSQEGEQ